MKAENMEIRAFSFEVRAQNDEEHGNFLEGTPIVYDSWTDLGWYDEMIDRGALAKTDLRDVRFLINHNTDMIPLARSRNNNENSTMQMSVDDEVGMKKYVQQFLMDNPAWSELTAVKNGRVYFMEKNLFNLKPNHRWGEAYEIMEEILANE